MLPISFCLVSTIGNVCFPPIPATSLVVAALARTYFLKDCRRISIVPTWKPNRLGRPVSRGAAPFCLQAPGLEPVTCGFETGGANAQSVLNPAGSEPESPASTGTLGGSARGNRAAL